MKSKTKLILTLLLLILPLASYGQDTLSVEMQAIISEDKSTLDFTIPAVALPSIVQTDTVFMYDEPAVFRGLSYQMQEDTTGAFAIRIKGQTSAEKIRYASKCIGYDQPTMTAIDDRLGILLTPDAGGNVNGVTRNYNCHYSGQNMNALLTYWLTAYTSTDTLTVRRFIDVAHIRGLGN